MRVRVAPRVRRVGVGFARNETFVFFVIVRKRKKTSPARERLYERVDVARPLGFQPVAPDVEGHRLIHIQQRVLERVVHSRAVHDVLRAFRRAQRSARAGVAPRRHQSQVFALEAAARARDGADVSSLLGAHKHHGDVPKRRGGIAQLAQVRLEVALADAAAGVGLAQGVREPVARRVVAASVVPGLVVPRRIRHRGGGGVAGALGALDPRAAASAGSRGRAWTRWARAGGGSGRPRRRGKRGAQHGVVSAARRHAKTCRKSDPSTVDIRRPARRGAGCRRDRYFFLFFP